MMEAVYVQLCFLKGVLLSVLGAAIRRLNPANLKLFTMKKDVQFLRGVNIVVVVMMFLIWKTLVLLVRGNLWAKMCIRDRDYPIDGSGGHVLKQCRCDNAESLAQLYLDMKRNYLMFPVVNKSPLF